MPPINLVSPSRNEFIVEGIAGGGPAHCMLLPSGIEGVHTEENAPVPTLENISTPHAIHAGIQEDATHPTPPSQPRRLFRTPTDVPRTPTFTFPPMNPTLVGPHPSPCVPPSNTQESDDEVPLCFWEAFKRNRASLKSRTAMPRGNVIVEVPHNTTIEQGGPSNHMQPMDETILARDTSMPPLEVVPPIVPSRASTRLKSKNAPESSLDPVAAFVANLRSQALHRQSTTFVGRGRPMMSRDVEGVPTINVDNGIERLPPPRALRRARRPREDGPTTNVTKQTKQTVEATGLDRTGKKTKIKNIGEFGCPGHVSDNSNDELSSKNDDISHAEAPSDSTYCEGD